MSADPDVAEAALTSDIDSIDASEPPGKDELLTLQTSVVRHSIRSLGTKTSAKRVRARSMLQVGLRPVLQLDNAPRVCLVLRLLLGYTISSCAQMLGMAEKDVTRLVRVGTRQLHRAVVRDRRRCRLSQENAESRQLSLEASQT